MKRDSQVGATYCKRWGNDGHVTIESLDYVWCRALTKLCSSTRRSSMASTLRCLDLRWYHFLRTSLTSGSKRKWIEVAQLWHVESPSKHGFPRETHKLRYGTQLYQHIRLYLYVVGSSGATFLFQKLLSCVNKPRWNLLRRSTRREAAAQTERQFHRVTTKIQYFGKEYKWMPPNLFRRKPEKAWTRPMQTINYFVVTLFSGWGKKFLSLQSVDFAGFVWFEISSGVFMLYGRFLRTEVIGQIFPPTITAWHSIVKLGKHMCEDAWHFRWFAKTTIWHDMISYDRVQKYPKWYHRSKG